MSKAGQRERQRRFRKRQRDGVQMVRIHVSQQMAEALLAARRITADQLGDTRAFAQAIEDLLKKE